VALADGWPRVPACFPNARPLLLLLTASRLPPFAAPLESTTAGSQPSPLFAASQSLRGRRFAAAQFRKISLTPDAPSVQTAAPSLAACPFNTNDSHC